VFGWLLRPAPPRARGWRVLLLLLLLSVPQAALAAWGARGMVASEHRLASEAGVEMLQRGGNAIDAAVATSFALGVVNPSSCGIGGGGFMLVYRATSRQAAALDYRETAPAAASRDMYVRDGKAVPELSRRGGLAVGVPGEVAGLAAALRRYGTLPWATVMEPAIRLARDGFPVGAHLAAEIVRNRDALRADATLAAEFFHADGSPLTPGETLRRPALAATLQRIADGGPSAFYHGEIAARIVESVQAAGGILTSDDLAGYRPVWRRPLVATVAGDRVYAMPPPSSAGVVLEVLDILQRDDLPALGRESGTYAHLLAEAMQHGFADRARFYGDPGYAPVPLPRLLAPSNTAALRGRISAVRTGRPDAYGTEAAPPVAAADHGTSHLSVMDDMGNAVACTTTVNTAFGALFTAAGTGIILNNEQDDFAAQPGVPNVFGLVGADANAVAPGKRPLSSMSPIIVTRHGEPILAVGGSGGPLIVSGTLQVVLNVLAFGLDARAAVAAPRLHHQWLPHAVGVEPGVPENVRTSLARRGHSVRELPAMGAVQAVRRDAGVFEGASDPRKGGEAVGW